MLLKKEEIELNDQDVFLTRAEILPIKPPQSPILIKMLSPIVVYSTFVKDCKKKTYYYNPQEADFEKLVLDNLKKKVMAFYGEGKYPELDGAYIRPYRVDEKNMAIVKYKGFVIKGWMGLFKLNLPEPYLSLAYDAGLGAKNSQGFGMWELYKEAMSERRGITR
jgi:CRISPR-associated endoribonuclease Cas6